MQVLEQEWDCNEDWIMIWICPEATTTQQVQSGVLMNGQDCWLVNCEDCVKTVAHKLTARVATKEFGRATQTAS